MADAEDKRDWTPLHHACFNDRRTVAKLLFTRGVRVDAKDRKGQTPMLPAAYLASNVAILQGNSKRPDRYAWAVHSCSGYRSYRRNRVCLEQASQWTLTGGQEEADADHWRQRNPDIDTCCTAENAIRPFVIGRKNWLFSDTERGAKASAALYGLIETAKANGLEPYAYLQRVFERLPAAQSVEDVEALLPWNLEAEATTAP